MQAELKAVADKVTYSLLTFAVNKTTNLERLKNYIGKGVTLNIDELKQSRTLSQNAYMWLLISKIADKLNAYIKGEKHMTKEDIYIDFIENYTCGAVVTIDKEDDDDFKRSVTYYKLDGENGKTITYRIFPGSSKFSTIEMKTLLNAVIAEAESLGIPTVTPNELAKMKVR